MLLDSQPAGIHEYAERDLKNFGDLTNLRFRCKRTMDESCKGCYAVSRDGHVVVKPSQNFDPILLDSHFLKCLPQRRFYQILLALAHSAGKGDLTFVRLHLLGAPREQKVILVLPFKHGHEHCRFPGESIGQNPGLQCCQAITNTLLHFLLNSSKAAAILSLVRCVAPRLFSRMENAALPKCFTLL